MNGRTVNRSPDAAPTISSMGRIRLASIDLTRNETDLFYNGFCNRTLWPLLHSFPDKMTIRHDAYRTYLRTNRRYAEVVASLLRPGDLV